MRVDIPVGLRLLCGTSLLCCCWRGRHYWPCYRGFWWLGSGLCWCCTSSWLPTKLHTEPCRRPSWSLWRHGRGLPGAGYISHIECVGWRPAPWYSFLLWSLPVIRRWSPRLWLQSIQYDLQHDFPWLADEAYCSVVLALLQGALLIEVWWSRTGSKEVVHSPVCQILLQTAMKEVTANF